MSGAPWLIDHVNGDVGSGGSSSTPCAIAGYPDVTVPMGYVHGLPLGINFMGRPWSEATLLSSRTRTSRRPRCAWRPGFSRRRNCSDGVSWFVGSRDREKRPREAVASEAVSHQLTIQPTNSPRSSGAPQCAPTVSLRGGAALTSSSIRCAL
jgi:hypothetical protein